MLLLRLTELLRLLWRLSELLCGLHGLGRLGGHARLLLLELWWWSSLWRWACRSGSWPSAENVSQAIKKSLWLCIGVTGSS